MEPCRFHLAAHLTSENDHWNGRFLPLHQVAGTSQEKRRTSESPRSPPVLLPERLPSARRLWAFPFGGPCTGSLQRMQGVTVLLPESFPRPPGVSPSAFRPAATSASGISPITHYNHLTKKGKSVKEKRRSLKKSPFADQNILRPSDARFR